MAKPKIIVFDLEILPDLKEALYVWPQLSNYPALTLKAQVSSIICAGYKYLNQKKTYCINTWDYKEWQKNKNNDYYLLKDFYNIIKDADAVVTHNGKSFDWRHLQTRLMKHGFEPLYNIPHIDTKNLAKSNLYAFNNKLGNLGKFFLDEDKLENSGWQLWVDVYNDEPKAKRLMTKYCKQDVNLLEKLFNKLKPFAKNIPNHNLFNPNNEKLCPSCGSSMLKSQGWRYTKTMSYRKMRCLDCKSFCDLDAKSNPRSI